MLEGDPEVDFTRDMIRLSFSWLQLVPAFVRCLVSLEIWGEADVSKKRLVVLLVVDRNVELGAFADDIAVKCEWIA